MESGNLGDRSLDIDRLAFRVEWFPGIYSWFGRSQPFFETGVFQPSYRSAIGSQWSQNQSNPLQPKLSGWVGGGLEFKKSDWSFAIAYSPFFLPNFGPRVEFSETEDTRGSRYARLPPQYVRLNNNLFPIRFKIDTGDIKDIIFQQQAYVGLTKVGSWGAVGLHAWTSPDTEPKVDTRDSLRVNEDQGSVVAFVQVKPRFPRREYLAATLRLNVPYLNPETEILRKSGNRQIISQTISPLSFLTIGWLDTLRGLSAPVGDGTDSPTYAQKLAWTDIHYRMGNFIPSMNFERHFTNGKEDLWSGIRLSYLPSQNWEIYGLVNLLVGKDESYFGAWRSLDSAGLGLRMLW
jgi:hypothetical protein